VNNDSISREEQRLQLAAMDRDALLYATALAIRAYLDSHSKPDEAIMDMAGVECAKDGREGVWDEAVALAKAAGRYGRIPKQQTANEPEHKG